MTTTTDSRFYVYAFFRKDGTPYYIGKGKGQRINECAGRRSKLPPTDRRKVLVDGLTEPEAFEYEIALIHCLGRKDLGRGCLRNLTDGGEGVSGRGTSVETRAKISAANKGRTFSPEHRTRLGAASKGRRLSFSAEHRAKLSAALAGRKGRDHSPETRAKLSAANKGRTFSPETRAKLSAAAKGRKPSPETRAQISAALTGRKGCTHGSETRARLSAAASAQHAARRAQREALSGQLSLLGIEVAA